MNKSDMVEVFDSFSGEWYAYDGRTGRILNVGESLVGKTPEETKQAVYAYLKGKKHQPDKPLPGVVWEHSAEEYIERIKTHIPALLLQLTRRCNLNCDYCVYSGNYAHMTPHISADMSYETIRRSIDFFAEHNRDHEEAMLDLYGGEVFLCFDRVQYAVAYAKEKLAGKPLRVRITSNGVLLDRRAASWIKKNPEVRVTVTVNGPYHDCHRKLLGGQGSLDLILKNLRMIREEFPEVFKTQIGFISNVAHPSHIGPLAAFFREQLDRAPDTITHIRDQDGNDAIGEMLGEDGAQDAMTSLAKAYAKTFDPVLDAYFGMRMMSAHNRYQYGKNDPGVIGSCFPFMEKLYVHYDGRFGLCETACDKLILGDLDRGFDEKKLCEIYEKTQELYNRTCAGCWAQRRCTVCFKDILNPDGTVMDSIPQGFCRASQEDTRMQLRLYTQIATHDPQQLKAYDQWGRKSE